MNGLKVLPFVMGVLLLSVMFLFPFSSALEWNIDINPVGVDAGFTIYAGKQASISITGPDDAMVYAEVIDSNTSALLVRFPITDFITLTGGIAVVIWDIPNTTATEPLWYLQLKSSDGALRDIRSFKINPEEEAPPPEDTTTIAELEVVIGRLEFELNSQRRQMQRAINALNAERQLLYILVTVAIGLGMMSAVAVFAPRSKTLRGFFWGVKETEETETAKRLSKLVSFFIRREIPEEYIEAFRPETPEPELPSKLEPELEPEPEKQEKPKKEQRKKGMYTKVCEFCKEEFETKVRLAKYCPDKPCRVNAFRARKAEKEGGDE